MSDQKLCVIRPRDMKESMAQKVVTKRSHTLFPAPYRSFRLNLPAADENKIRPRLAFTATHTGNLSQQIFEIGAQH